MRWAGRRVQPQNFPRGTIKKAVPHATAAILGDATPDDLELLFSKSALEVVASCLRGIFVASRDCHLVVGDLAQIEARIIAWLAGQKDILDVFTSGEDVYTYTAGRLGSHDRQFGKVLVLACGFGMGPGRFQATAQTYGISLTLAQADNAVHGWRHANPHIVQFWYALGNAMADLISAKPGWEIKVGCLTLLRGQRGAAIELPSGRRMFYHDLKRGPDGDITFMGVDPKTKHWSLQRTYGGKLAENVTQAIARDVMCEALIEYARHRDGGTLVGTIHDEIISEEFAEQAPHALAVLLEIMRRPVAWAPGLPVDAEGWHGPRYQKS
jgi:DNA polymerase